MAILAIPGMPGSTSNGAVPLETLLNGVGLEVKDGSVRQRLGQRWGYDFDSPPAGIDPNRSLLDYFHLASEDFAQGREYLANEITAFSRSLSPDAQVDMVGLPAGTTVKYKLFGATAHPPKDLPPSYYSALARYSTVPPSLFPDDPSEDPRFDLSQQSTDTDPEGSFRLDLASGIDAALTQVGVVLQNQAALDTSLMNPQIQFPPELNPQLRSDVMNPLATLLSGGERLGRATICRSVVGNDPTAEGIVVYVNGFDMADGLRIVRGEDGLRCAVGGNIEGASCTTQFDDTLTLAQVSFATTPFASFEKGAFGFFVTPLHSLDGTRLHLVRRRGQGESPGSFLPVVGMQLLPNQLGGCVDLPIIPDVERRAAAIMAPSPKWCTSPNLSCADTTFDARLPLEDELSQDSNGVESSWKHYLTLARQAADQADKLGQDFLQSGLAIDEHQESIELRDEQKAELVEDKALAAIADLQTTCGTAIDPLRLLHILSTGTDGTTLDLMRTDQHCGDPMDNACPANFRCMTGVCVADLKVLLSGYQSDPIQSDLKRLADCINGDDVKDYVHLGSKNRPLCLWHEFNDARRICEGADADHPCPILSLNGNCNNLNVPPVCTDADRVAGLCDIAGQPPTPERVKVLVSEGLEFLDTTDLPTFGFQKQTICDRVRSLRAHPGSTADLTAVVRSNQFNWLRVKTLAKRIGFEARYGGFSAVRLDGASIFTTGSPWDAPLVQVKPTDPTPPWPCGPASVQGCPTTGPAPGLLCSFANCGSLESRSDINDRL
ncbi:MAG TPA: hypothetical protein VKT80_09450, partial [Chloroflexota bacterium]|nr:hypothetical protein [Chloroflexota bacterium]